MSGQTKVLAVDDKEPARLLLSALLEAAGYAVVTAEDGVQALDVLEREGADIDVILLDRRMPNMDGMEVMSRLKADPDLRNIPVIMQTAADSDKEVCEGIQAGVFYYLTKPFERGVLLSITRAAVDDHIRYRKLQDDVQKRSTALGFMTRGAFEIRSITEGRSLAVTLASAFPKPRARVTGLSELLANAVEHGNLGITYEEKTRFIAEKTLDEEMTRRLESEEHRDKRVTVDFRRHDDRIEVTIADQGQGFDWKKYMDMDPRRVFESHGRGIALAARLSFDELDYQGCGNVVTATVFLKPGEAA